MADQPTLLVTRKLPEAVEARARHHFAAQLNADDQPLDRAAMISAAQGCDGILCCPADKLGPDLIAGLPDRIKIIATFSVGYEHVDLEAAKARGIVVTNTPGVLTDATADIALLLILAASRRAYEGETLLRADQWPGWAPTQLMGVQLTGKRLGILGLGRIGLATAKRAQAFGMDIHYHSRNPAQDLDGVQATYYPRAEDLLAVSDVLSIHCPLTPETQGFLNTERLGLLPENSIVVNTARGPIIDDDALIAALKSGRVRAAGLDVFTGEPDLHPGYRTLDNATLLPHLGSGTVETRNAMGFKALDNLEAFFNGVAPPDRVA